MADIFIFGILQRRAEGPSVAEYRRCHVKIKGTLFHFGPDSKSRIPWASVFFRDDCNWGQ